MSTCKSCHADVDFARFEESGKWGIFDTEEAEARPGEVRWVLEHDRTGSSGTSRWARRAKVGEVGVVSHYSTCPDAERHRR